MTITIASSSATQEELNRMAGVPAEEKPAVETQSAEVDESSKTAADSETAVPEKKADEQPKPKKGGFQLKIDKLTKRAGTLERELEEERERAKELEKRLGEKSSEKPEAKPEVKTETKELDPKDFPNYEAYLKAEANRIAEEKFNSLTAKQKADAEKQAQDERDKEVFETYHAAVQEASENIPDWDDVYQVVKDGDMKIPSLAQVPIIEAGKYGPYILYYLAKNPEVAEELFTLSPSRIAARIGQIEILVAEQVDKESPSKKEKETAAPSPKPKPVSTAPAPINPVGGGTKQQAELPVGNNKLRDYRRARESGVGR